jgi:predicted Zn-dependent protease
MEPSFFRTTDRELGDWLHDELAKECFIETDGWARQRVERVTERLQKDAPAEDRRETVILWTAFATAFTAPGRYIYITRPLLERCPDDECAAFVIAHELAHHHLGHLRHFPEWATGLRGVPVRAALAVIRELESRIYGPELECEADRRALELCLAAGYDRERCLHLLEILQLYALDIGDVDIVYGPDPESDQELAEDASWCTKAKIWMWQRTRGYLPLQDRLGLLRRQDGPVSHQ